MLKTITDLPQHGFSRWNQISSLVGVSKSQFRSMVLSQKAPQPTQLSTRVTVYSNAELHKWFADPLAYKAEVTK